MRGVLPGGARVRPAIFSERRPTSDRASAVFVSEGHPAADRDFRFHDQLFVAAAGASAHIAEGFSRRTLREFRQFLSYARSSIAEALTWIEDGLIAGTSRTRPQALPSCWAGARQAPLRLCNEA